ncbi:hypothetical protein BD324DRAFT_680542 [Kockovaella imperatae]|uniref:Uncharacterized protein n=1 Tax=Kockovaella imperatae TaxID=4999 RepID=A0A1Y1UJF6_9TREE|nr:hypothetical protein BD324DRAFT_680542 [Kockovaella imperatae]ORX37634.1 hypothetical protein BD324DRAFT_680542 [Kockovaella imperatae]
MKGRIAALWIAVAPFVLPVVLAGDASFGQACDQSHTHLDTNTWNLVTDCDATTWCADNSTCANKGCRKDIYPFGYNNVPFDKLPPLCPTGQFCPDEGSYCLPQEAVGDPCQKDRDDECQPPPNYKQLAGFLNVNGSICLNFTCFYANVTLGQNCKIDNTVYTAYTAAGSEYAFIVSRDNCANGLYCDGTALKCFRAKLEGAACAGNKECLTYNCQNNKCDRAAYEPIHPPAWVFVVVGLGIVALIVVTMVSLWFTHRRTRRENQVKLEQYYNEQIAYRQSIMTMSNAKKSLMSLPADTPADVARRSVFGDDYSSFMPPNMRREDSTAAWSSAASDVHLLEPNTTRRRI